MAAIVIQNGQNDHFSLYSSSDCTLYHSIRVLLILMQNVLDMYIQLIIYNLCNYVNLVFLFDSYLYWLHNSLFHVDCNVLCGHEMHGNESSIHSYESIVRLTLVGRLSWVSLKLWNLWNLATSYNGMYILSISV